MLLRQRRFGHRLGHGHTIRRHRAGKVGSDPPERRTGPTPRGEPGFISGGEQLSRGRLFHPRKMHALHLIRSLALVGPPAPLAARPAPLPSSCLLTHSVALCRTSHRNSNAQPIIMRQDGPLPPSPPAAASADADEATPSNTAGAGALLFLVDDQAGMRSAVQKYLVQSGFRVSRFQGRQRMRCTR